jgi:hypothetical protein
MKINTEHSSILIYNAWWFEAIMVFFVISFMETSRGINFGKRKMGYFVALFILIFIIS